MTLAMLARERDQGSDPTGGLTMMMPARSRMACAIFCVHPARGGTPKYSLAMSTTTGSSSCGDHIDPSTRRIDLPAASGVDYRSDLVDVGRIDGALKQLTFLRVLLAPVDRHEKRAPWHSRINEVAEREVVEALKHLANVAGPGDNKELFEDEYRSKASQEAETEFKQPKMTEEKARHSINEHVRGEAYSLDEVPY